MMNTPYQMWLQLTLIISLMLIVITAHSQITTDGTVGSAQSLTGPNYTVGAGLGTQRGTNLFHSFSTFNIHTGESATFTGPSGLQNVISRVTGGSLSSIDGTLRSEINGANVWFINPVGVVFGANAKLDVPAAFHVSTADELRFADGAKFSAANPGISTLSTEPIAAFGFTSAAPKRIEVNGGFLSVKEGQILSLVGGDINLSNATIYAPAGRLNIASVGSAGEVALTETDMELRGFGALGTLTMVRDPDVERVTVDGDISLGDLDTSGEGGGAMFIRGGNWLNQGGWAFARTYGNTAGQNIHVKIAGTIRFDEDTRLLANTIGSGNAGSVTVTAGNLLMNGGGRSGIASNAYSTGAGGDITLTVAETLTILNGGQILVSTQGASDAGDITIATRNLLIDGQGSRFLTGIGSVNLADSGAGAGGNVAVTVVDSLTLRNGSSISAGTWGQGDAGDITITSRNLLVDRQDSPLFTGIHGTAEAGSAGAAADINITVTDTLALLRGQINTSTWGTGDAGEVTIHAGNLLVDGQGFLRFTGIASQVNPGSTGTGGNMNLTVADTLSVVNGGEIGTSTFAQKDAGDITITARNLLVDGQNSTKFTGIASQTNPGSIGIGGDLSLLVTDTLTLLNSGNISATTWGAGNAGSITVAAGRSINISGYDEADGLFFPSGLLVSAYSTGQAGDITLTTPALIISDGGGIFATSTRTTGGNLFINAADLRLFNGGEISASVAGDATTTGGNVEINSRTVLALDGSTVTARAKQGKGGNILVNTDVFLHNAPSIDDVLNASSESTVTGNQGSVTVNTALDPGRSIVGVSRRLGDLNDAAQDPCARRKGQKKSTLTKVGRGGLPADNRPEGMTVSLSGGDWTPPAEPAEPALSTQEPLALSTDRDDCRL